MDAMDADRLELYELLKPKLDEEPARRLVLALGPTPETVVTKDYLDARLSEQTAVITEKLTWRMVTVMGAWTAIGVSLFAFMSQLFR
jgi:hypothetical protein